MISFFEMGAVLATLLHAALGQTPLGAGGSPAFAALNISLGGRLALGVPWTEPCFSSFNGVAVPPNATQCAYVQQNYFNSHIPRSDAFGAYSATQFEMCMATGDQCLLDFTNAANPAAFAPPADCKQGSISPFYIDVQSTNDVVIAMNFARNTKMPLIVKNTGHDFKGRSAAPGALALWTHHLKTMTHVKSFVADGCNGAGKEAITIAAGVQFNELFQFADGLGLEIVGGSDQTVGAAGGFLQGGGHSSITPSSGMAVDRVLQYKIVTTDGSYRTANACQNSDLFFALRGGGGGTFGVVMEATVIATKARPYQIASINWPPSDANNRQILSMFIDNATALATAGWGGYLTPGTGSFVITNPNFKSAADAKKSVQTLFDLATKLGGQPSVVSAKSFFEWFTLFVDNKLSFVQDSVGLPNALTSRLIPAENHKTAAGRAQLLDAMTNAFSNTIFAQIHLTTPFGFKGSDGSDTSVNPIWRTSLYQVILVNTWLVQSTLADRQGAYAASTKAANFLRAITPNSGAYHNEADIHEPNFEQSFWGQTLYNKLLTIKNKYDPTHLLDCWNCIGWKGASSPQFKCYI
ncbi:hypothetical protein GALMADRAFT_142193 [Galerina marginata CBS 339.88]|uniref:FAD-binding PCMH-type domain-containing protein n=1 Tax=Galerina marginata (strain CBS 339.88) TaxID=685588 RepID=A0A067SS04_GALM3|nr:hypothetical protein GALMADRAFT_142193 [Galerina marginata CBS 339.88]